MNPRSIHESTMFVLLAVLGAFYMHSTSHMSIYTTIVWSEVAAQALPFYFLAALSLRIMIRRLYVRLKTCSQSFAESAGESLTGVAFCSIMSLATLYFTPAPLWWFIAINFFAVLFVRILVRVRNFGFEEAIQS